MTEHLIVQWMRRDTGKPDDQIRAAEAEAARLEAWWAELRALAPGAVPEADVVDLILRLARIVSGVEARVHHGSRRLGPRPASRVADRSRAPGAERDRPNPELRTRVAAMAMSPARHVRRASHAGAHPVSHAPTRPPARSPAGKRAHASGRLPASLPDVSDGGPAGPADGLLGGVSAGAESAAAGRPPGRAGPGGPAAPGGGAPAAGRQEDPMRLARLTALVILALALLLTGCTTMPKPITPEEQAAIRKAADECRQEGLNVDYEIDRFGQVVVTTRSGQAAANSQARQMATWSFERNGEEPRSRRPRQRRVPRRRVPHRGVHADARLPGRPPDRRALPRPLAPSGPPSRDTGRASGSRDSARTRSWSNRSTSRA